jgi:hypothetical protein
MTLCFALGFGLNFGKSNHASYLLASEKLLDPQLWTRDFQVSTQHYHPAYARLGALLLMLDGSGWLIALANVVAVAAGVWLVARLQRSLWPERDVAAFAAFSLLMCLAAASRTSSVGGAYVFSDILQPSTLGSLGLLAAALALARGQALLSGLGLALAGAFHLNYLVLALPVFGLGWLLGDRERPLRSTLLGVLPALPILIWFLPLLIASGAGSPQVTEEARRIYQDVRAPHHYHVKTFAPAFLPWLGFLLVGAAALWDRARQSGPERRLLGLLAGFAALIVPAALLSSVVVVRAIDSLFAWRLTPHSNLLAQAAFACAAAPALLGAPSEPTSKPARALLLGGVACLVLAALLGPLRSSALIALAVLVLAWARPRWEAKLGTAARQRLPELTAAALLLTFAVAEATPLSELVNHSDLLGGRDRDLQALCGWVKQHTPKDSLILSPPDEEGVRFRCQRAIVVDWKTTPILPGELLQWSQRLEDVTGRRPLRAEADMVGYSTLDGPQLSALAARYGADLLLLEKHAAFTPKTPPAFEQGRFRLYRLPLDQ